MRKSNVKCKERGYRFEDLPKEIQERVLEKNRHWNTEMYDWWDSVEEDALRIGLNIKSFDLCQREIEGEFVKSIQNVIKAILDDHGKSCETYKTAKLYQPKVRFYYAKCRLLEIDPYYDDLEGEELTDKFLQALLRDYLKILDKEYEYLTSDEAIRESIEAGAYQFDLDGNLL